MSDARIIVEGRIASDPRYSATQSGTQVGNLRVLAGRSRKDDQGVWQTLSTTAYAVAFWGPLHDLMATLNPDKGDSVIVTGTVSGVESYQGSNGESLTVQVNADGLRVFPKRQAQAQPQGYGQQGGQGFGAQQSYGAPQGQQSDPWSGQGGGGYDNPSF